MTLLFQQPAKEWECKRCGGMAVTRRSDPHTQFHGCPQLGGFNSPMTLVGSGSRVRLVEREDYIGDEDVQLANGRPIMAAVTDHRDGSNDCAVYAPTALLRGDT